MLIRELISKTLPTQLYSLLFAFALVAPAQAVPITFSGEDLNPIGSGRIPLAGSNSEAARNAFLASLVGVGTEDFESFANGTGAPLALSFTGSSGAITGTITGASAIDEVTTGTSGAGRWPTSGNKYWTTNSSSSGFSISFSSPVSAFGFYATDVGDFNGQLSLALEGDVPTPATLALLGLGLAGLGWSRRTKA